ncbi:PspC domain-containing protein [Paenibacillus sp. CAA11]|uniref:PspC domain-containing protein n=1 Tax=Paenibacillus sp. CAA11 TaxID=1532905 RepID=UPI000D3B0024|nr:PspC domain-containing protein [Paenibacillus sp. CAA11]AWB43183.1 PspC domain-containing protein [Paenibacillus sp. CAA11]
MNKLYRSRSDKKLSGLCGGIANWLRVDPTVVRLITVIAAFCSFGTVFALYLIASLLVPEEPYGSFDFDDYHSHY